MSNIVLYSEFGNSAGDWKLAVNNLTDDSQNAFITRYQRDILVKLLGAELYTLFVASLSGTPGVPAAGRFLTIFNAFASDDFGGAPVVSDGMKYLVMGHVWFQYSRDIEKASTIGGAVESNYENSLRDKARSAQWMKSKYAKAIATFNAIRTYILNNSSTYPEYNGIKLEEGGFHW